MLELRQHIDDGIWIRDPMAGGATPGAVPAVGEGGFRAELAAGSVTVETRMDYRHLGGDPNLGVPASVLAGCGLTAGLAPSTQSNGVRLGVQLRGGVTAADPRCRQGRFELGGGLRLETPIADSRVSVFANGVMTSRGSPLAGSPASRRGHHRIEVGVELAREVDASAQRLAITGFRGTDRETVDADQPFGQRATGVAIAYERGISFPVAPGASLRSTVSAEGHIARLSGPQPATEVAALVRLRVTY